MTVQSGSRILAKGKAEVERAKAIDDARRLKARSVAVEIIADCTGVRGTRWKSWVEE